jgi:hypothetical protein
MSGKKDHIQKLKLVIKVSRIFKGIWEIQTNNDDALTKIREIQTKIFNGVWYIVLTH